MPSYQASPIRVQFTAVGAKIKPIATAAMTAALLANTEAFALNLIEELKVYPPPAVGARPIRSTKEEFARLGPRYETFDVPRSYNLQRSWRIQQFTATSGGIGYRIYNNANESGRMVAGARLSPNSHRYYAQWVQGSFQTWFHKENEWLTVEGALEKRKAGARGGFVRLQQDIINYHLGLGR